MTCSVDTVFEDKATLHVTWPLLQSFIFMKICTQNVFHFMGDYKVTPVFWKMNGKTSRLVFG
jgi:hypothetical protein